MNMSFNSMLFKKKYIAARNNHDAHAYYILGNYNYTNVLESDRSAVSIFSTEKYFISDHQEKLKSDYRIRFEILIPHKTQLRKQ